MSASAAASSKASRRASGSSRTQRVAYDQQTEAFGPGSNGPFLLAVDTPKGAPATERQLAALQQAVADTPGIASVPPATVSEDGEMATIFAIPTTAPQDARTGGMPWRGRSPETGGLREEAARVIRNSGDWIPAIQNGRKVKSYKKQPVIFKLMQQ